MGETNKTYLVKVCESQYKLSGSWYMNQARLLQFRLRRLNISVIFEVIKDDEEPTFLDAKDIGYELGMYEGLGTKEEQIERHRLNAIEVKRRWREENKDKIKERRDKYYNENRDKILETHKEYRQTHKEQIREKNKKYLEANKDKIYTRQCQKYICDCGSEISLRHKSSHNKSKNHLQYLESIK